MSYNGSEIYNPNFVLVFTIMHSLYIEVLNYQSIYTL